MSTSISVTDVSSAGGAVMHDKTVRSEILCFIQNKPANVLTFDSVVDLCCNFYTADEVEQSRLLLTQFQTQHRLPKHKGNEADKKKRTVSDIVKACVDPSVLLPTFYAVDLARLPPVGVEHVDISALLLEVASLRAEVRAMVAIKEELANMHSAVAALNVEADAWPKPGATRAAGPEVAMENSLITAPQVIKKSAAQVVKETIRTGTMAVVNKKTKSVVGNANNGKLRAVAVKKTVHVFVSRLDPTTTADEVKDCVIDAIGNSLAESDNSLLASVTKDTVGCNKLNTKHDTYASFHVSCPITANSAQHLTEILMNSNTWPLGVYVRRYFVNKINHE